jgi:hypothetical protein
MSVNPMNARTLSQYLSSNTRTEQQIRSFNSAIWRQLCLDGTYTYINCYSYLQKNGYSTQALMGSLKGKDDGLHYSAKTCKRIFEYCMKTLYQTKNG